MSRASGLSPRAAAPVHTWLTEPLSHDVKLVVERLVRADDVAHVAVMPDCHVGKVTLAVIVNMESRGFEGMDRTFLAVTRVLAR